MQQPAYQAKRLVVTDDTLVEEVDGLIQHKIGRVKKKLNDYIL